MKPAPKSDKKAADTSKSDNIQIVKEVIRRRRRASQRCGCKALLRLRHTEDNKYVVYTFFEKHNHPLVQENDYKYLRAARKLSFPKQQLLYQLSNANLGPTRAWKVFKEMFGGFENIGFTDVECRNYRRGLNMFIGERDAQMVVEKLLSRKEFSDFSVEYKQDKKTKSLVGLFWADEQAKRHYAAFGDVVSFDATFRSNRFDAKFIFIIVIYLFIITFIHHLFLHTRYHVYNN